MVRLIDADALLDFLDVGHLRPPTEICFSELMMKNIIDLQPTVEAVPVVHARWLWLDGVRCSKCNYKLQTTGIPSYCPHCGAKMDEVTYDSD